MTTSNLRIVSENDNLGWRSFVTGLFIGLGSEIMEEIHYVEQFFIRMRSIYGFISQVCFFILVDSIIENNDDFRDIQSDKSVITALTTILFYSVFGYFASRIREVFQRQRTSWLRSFLSTDHLLHWVCKLILEWAKAVIIVLCLREQGIDYQPNFIYSIVTFAYYLCSEKIFIESFPEIVEYCNIDSLDNMEHLYVPMLLNSIAVSAGFCATSYIFLKKYSTFVLLCIYFLVYIRLKDIYHNYWKILNIEKKTFKSFRVATKEDIIAWADICAICLNTMSRARITPCNHLFHPHCLKQCLKRSLLCPLCKSNFLNHISNK